MMVHPIDSPLSTSEVTGGYSIQGPSSMTDFGDWLSQEVSQVNSQINTADTQVQQLALGHTDNLHHVMLALDKASLSFDLMVQVRNKLMDGYQEVMRMQV